MPAILKIIGSMMWRHTGSDQSTNVYPRDAPSLLVLPFWIKKASLVLRMESRLEKIFSMENNNMSLAMWLGEDRKCSAAVVGFVYHYSVPILSLLIQRARNWEKKGYRDGAAVRALASHQCGLGSIPRSGVKCGLSLLVFFSAPRGFIRVLRFPLSSKTKIWLDCVNC